MEICLMKRLDGEPGVVKLLDYYKRQDSFIIVMERPENCKDLFDFITGKNDHSLDKIQCILPDFFY